MKYIYGRPMDISMSFDNKDMNINQIYLQIC